MKKTSLAFCAAVTVLACNSAALAQQTDPSMYAEIGYTSLNVKADSGATTVKFSPAVVNGVFGYRLHPNIALEGMLGLGAGSDDVKFNGASLGVDGKIGSSVGVFVRPSLALGESVELFGRAGVVHTTLRFSGPGGSLDDSGNDFAYGFGVNVNLSKTSYLQGSWMNHYDKDGVKIDGIGIAYGFRF